MRLKYIFSHDFKYTLINQIVKLLSGPLILLLIPIYLTAQEQGYWFTIVSLAALSVFADLGFTAIVLQFSAHEFAYLKFDENKQIIGASKYLERLSSLLHFALKWSFKISAIAFPIILIIGYYILSQKNDEGIIWDYAWFIYGFASILIFLNNIIISFIEGCDSVGDMQKIRFFIIIINSIVIIIGLILGFNLYSLSFALLISSIIGSFLIYNNSSIMLKQLYYMKINILYNWNDKILPLLGRYSISWISGYFIFSIFTPLVFYFYGSELAGKIGLSISLWVAIFGISNIWITVILPKINMHISKKNYKILNEIYYKHFRLSIATFVLGIIVFFMFYYSFVDKYIFLNRFLDPFTMIFLALGWLGQVIVNTLAIYIRAHKVEPLVIPSVVSAIYIVITTLLIIKFLSFNYFFLGFASSYIFGIPWVIVIFLRYQGGKYEVK
jgi:hypothetical protein